MTDTGLLQEAAIQYGGGKMKTYNTLLIINPHAGLLNPAAPGVDEIRHLASKILPGAEIVETRSEDHAAEVIRKALSSGGGIIAAAGGDGTAHFIAGLLAGTDSALGLVPLGSAGNVARSLGIPKSPRAALAAIRRASTKAIDLGYFNDTHFIEAAGIGFHAGLLRRYARKEKKSLARGIYALTKTILEETPFTAEMNIDGKKITHRAVQITVSNLPLYGTGFRIAPDARPSDGMLDITVIGEMPAIAVPQLAAAAALGILNLFPGVERFRGKNISISTDIPVAAHADAEIRPGSPAVFSVRKHALKVIVP